MTKAVILHAIAALLLCFSVFMAMLAGIGIERKDKSRDFATVIAIVALVLGYILMVIA